MTQRVGCSQDPGRRGEGGGGGVRLGRGPEPVRRPRASSSLSPVTAFAQRHNSEDRSRGRVDPAPTGARRDAAGRPRPGSPPRNELKPRAARAAEQVHVPEDTESRAFAARAPLTEPESPTRSPRRTEVTPASTFHVITRRTNAPLLLYKRCKVSHRPCPRQTGNRRH